MELRDKDRGTKLEALHSAPVHTRQLGTRMLSTVCHGPPAIGPHKNGACTVSGAALGGPVQYTELRMCPVVRAERFCRAHGDRG